VLEQPRVASHECGRREAKDLPEGEVPRHHREHDADRLIEDEAFPVLGGNVAAREMLLGVLRVVAAGGGALRRLLHRRANRLAHFSGHQASKLTAFLLEQLGGLCHNERALRERRPAPAAPRLMRRREARFDLLGRVRLDRRQQLTRGWVD
jgi:hypothetical protein